MNCSLNSSFSFPEIIFQWKIKTATKEINLPKSTWFFHYGSPFDHFEWFTCVLNNKMTLVPKGKRMELIFPQAFKFLHKNANDFCVAPTKQPSDECWVLSHHSNWTSLLTRFALVQLKCATSVMSKTFDSHIFVLIEVFISFKNLHLLVGLSPCSNIKPAILSTSKPRRKWKTFQIFMILTYFSINLQKVWAKLFNENFYLRWKIISWHQRSGTVNGNANKIRKNIKSAIICIS